MSLLHLRGRRSHWLALVGAAYVAVLACAWPALASEPPGVLERRVKAAYLYKFTAYIQWPAAMHALPDMPFTIGVMDDDEMLAELQSLVRGHTVEGHPIQVRAVGDDPLPEGLHMLYVPHAHTAAVERIATQDRAPSMLVVTDAPGALRRGSMVNFVLTDGHVRFEISLGAADRAGLSLSSRLLAVAQTVTRNP